jgi:1,4-alpha-glucan branching enzyme
MINRLVLSLFCMCFTSIGFSQNGGGANNMASAVMYEVNTRQYSEKGTFAEVTQNLKRIKSLGIDIVWMMPIHPIGVKNRKGTLGSYYSVQDYKGINPSYGDTADFRKLVNTAHTLGMKVIIDWVANHTAWDHAWIQQHPDWYVRDDKGNIQTQYDWSDVAKLDFTNKEMRAAMISDMAYWVNTFGIDGFRCDVAFLVPQDFWEQARAQLESIKPMYMLAEMEWNADITPTPNAYFEKAFNTSYGWNYMGVSQDMAKGKKTLSDFRKELQENYHKFPAKMTKLYFITNHDENSWNGTIEEKYGAHWKLYATLCYTLPKSMPLMYTGEEAGLNRRLSFFEKDPILQKEWADTSRYGWYRNMIQLRHTNKALWNLPDVPAHIMEVNFPGADSSITNNVFAFSRKADKNEVIVITNFGETEVIFQPTMLTFDPAKFKMLFNDHQFTKNEKGMWILKANENVILYK